MAVLSLTGEPSLDELLGDEMMGSVLRRAGTDAAELRRSLADLARRLGRLARGHSGGWCRRTGLG